MINLGIVRLFQIISTLALVSWTLSAGAIHTGEDPPAKRPSGGIAGSWYGTLKVGAVDLPLVIRLSGKPDGTHIGTLDAPDSGRKDLPVEEVVRNGTKILLKFKVVPVSFEGKLSDDSTELTGTWTQAGQALPVTFRRLGEPPAAKLRPQEPKRPYPYLDQELAQSQAALMLKAAGASEEQIEKNRRLQRALIDVLKRENDEKSAEKALRRVLAGHFATLNAQEKQTVGDLSAFSDAQIRPWLSPGFRFYLAFDPRPMLMKVHCPVLALNGEKDLVVASALNLDAIESALKAGGNRDFTVMALPGLNHLFQTCKTGAFEECSQIDETIAPVALDQVGRWLVKRTEGR